MSVFTQRIAALIGRAGSRNQARAPSALEPILIDGQGRITSVRSGWGQTAMQWVMRPDETNDYDPVTLAQIYKRCVTAFMAINARAGIDSEIPLRVVDENEKPVTNSPASAFLERAPRYIWRAMASYLIWGAYYFLKINNHYGYPTKLEWLNPLDVRVDLDYSTDQVRGFYIQRGGQLKKYPRQAVIAEWAFNPFDDTDGTSALEVAMDRINVEINIARFGAAFFRNSARPDMLLTIEGQAMTPAQRDEVRTYWNGLFKGVVNAFRTAIMGGNWKVQMLSPNPVDLAMPELNDQADLKICGAIGVHPALVGLNAVSDQLSAQNTYKQIRQNQVEFTAIADARRLMCDALNDQWLHQDFPRGHWTLMPDLAAIMADAMGTGDRVVTAQTAVTGGVWTVSEAREYTGKPPIKGIIERPAEVSLLNSQLLAGGLMLNEYRRLLGHAEIPTGNVFFIPAGNIQVKIEDVGQMQPKPSYQPFGNPQVDPWQAAAIAQGQLPPPPEPTNTTSPQVMEAEVEPVPARRNESIMAQLHEIGLWAKRVKRDGPQGRFAAEILPQPLATWIRNSLAAGTAPAQVFEKARSLVRNGLEPPDSGHAAYVVIDFSDGEKAEITRLFGAPLQQALGSMHVKEWQDPATYHITLVYAPDVPDEKLANILKALAPGFPPLTVRVTGLGVFDNRLADEGRAVHLVVEKTPELMGLQMAVYAAFKGEGIEISVFSVPDDWKPHITLVYLPSDTPLPDITLPAADLPALSVTVNRDDYQVVSERPCGIWPGRSAKRVAPDEIEDEAEDYWRDYDSIQAEIGDAWLNDYMNVLWGRLENRLTGDITDAEIMALMEGLNSALMESWIGTPQQPGPMLKMALAGVTAGQKSLEREGRRSKPTRQGLNIAIDWNLLSQEALAFIQSYLPRLIRGVNQTTLEATRKAIEAWLKTGAPLTDLTRALEVIYQDKARAAKIAATESGRLYFEGSAQRWENAGVTEAVWQTSRDSLVCPVCRPLHQVAGSIRDGWIHPQTRAVYRVPAHPSCRCGAKPRL